MLPFPHEVSPFPIDEPTSQPSPVRAVLPLSLPTSEVSLGFPFPFQAFQLGPTEASYYWVYWVPTQYVDAIKDTVLGKWQYF